jgi:glycine cleavage system transcriptional repressor
MLAAMRRYALLAIGQDRPGIVAGATGAMLQHGVNVEDSQMTILHGHFTMMLILAVPDEADVGRLNDDIAAAFPLGTFTLNEIEDAAPGPEPSHIVSVYGADHVGIVHAVAAALAERDIDITDLNSRLLEEAEPVYVLMLEVALPQDASVADLDDVLSDVAADEGVEVTLRELDRDEL